MMTATTDPVALHDWYTIGRSRDVGSMNPLRTRLLGCDIVAVRDAASLSVRVAEDGGRPGRSLPVLERYGHIWTSLGVPERDLFDIPEFEEADRVAAACGGVRVRASGLRLVENFIDMAHFPFVHSEILGTEERAEVERYDCEIREDVDEIWATSCKFWRPLPTVSAEAGHLEEYTYRIARPFNVMLFKSCAHVPGRLDMIGLFIQPVEEDVSLAHCLVLPIRPHNSVTGNIRFQQMIFLQDRIILENQRPLRLPLSPKAEMPTRADMSSIAYRRWLKKKGLRFGIEEFASGSSGPAA